MVGHSKDNQVGDVKEAVQQATHILVHTQGEPCCNLDALAVCCQLNRMSPPSGQGQARPSVAEAAAGDNLKVAQVKLALAEMVAQAQEKVSAQLWFRVGLPHSCRGPRYKHGRR